MKRESDGAEIAIANLQFRYRDGGPRVLRGVDVTIRGGAVTAVLGPNGVGKTTFLNCVLGWLTPQAGEIRVAGRNTADLSRRGMGRLLSLLPQEERLPFEYRVIDYVLLGRAPYLSPVESPGAVDRTIAMEALERVGMADHHGSAVTGISGGERQLVMLARCLAQQPRVLLMDEPTSHLDLGNKRRLADLVRSLVNDGTTVVFTTHDPEFAAACADDVLMLRDGALLAHGSVRETLSGERLSAVFGLPVDVVWVAGRPAVMW
tara:strand:+ start:358 stop:1143 length:786 start_codon:yes stop_codon:yes gene_type:complete